MSHDLDALATNLFTIALRSGRAGELLACLFDGGDATVDAKTGELVMVDGGQLQAMWDEL